MSNQLNERIMKNYKIAVKETCEVIVEVEAESLEEAKEKAYDAYNNGELDLSQGDSEVYAYLWE